MTFKNLRVLMACVVFPGLAGMLSTLAQPDFDGPPPGGFGGFGRGPGPGGPGMQEERKVVSRFDKDGDGRLNAAERKAAREWLKTENAGEGRRFGRRGPGNEEPANRDAN